MKLSDLNTGERGVIVKILGHGGFRKRIVEMGFIKGKVVEVLLNAPLKDPVKYKIMGYEVSLRHKEAEMIEVISIEEAREMETTSLPMDGSVSIDNDDTCMSALTYEQLRNAAMRKRRAINVALVGNPTLASTVTPL